MGAGFDREPADRPPALLRSENRQDQHDPRQLRYANGVCIAHDGKSLFFAESWACRVHRYWFDGPKAGRVECVISDMPGYPDNINRASDGTYWMAWLGMRTPSFDLALRHPGMRKRMTRRLPKDEWLFPNINTGGVVKFDEAGRIIETLGDLGGASHPMVTSMREHQGLALCRRHPQQPHRPLSHSRRRSGLDGPALLLGGRQHDPRLRCSTCSAARPSRFRRWMGRSGPTRRSTRRRCWPSAGRPTISASTASGYLFSSGPRSWHCRRRRVPSPQASPGSSANVAALAAAPAGRIAIALANGQLLLRDGSAAPVPVPPADGLACPTALAFAGDDTLYVCHGSATHGPEDWVVDLMEGNAGGSVWRIDLGGGTGAAASRAVSPSPTACWSMPAANG